MVIFLIGFMGSGKSYLGQELAKLMRCKFIDTDAEIERISKKKIKTIFEKDGEEYFRSQEHRVLLSLLKETKAVVATGGGMPCFFDNLQLMNIVGTTVYLETSHGVLFHRLVNEKENRPLLKNLKTVELMDFISQKLEERRPFYENAKLKVNAETITAAKLKKRITKK